MIFEHSNYRTYLKSVLSERIAKNPLYSLRSMAAQLGLAPSTLSEVLNGISNISNSTATLIANKLGLTNRQDDYFFLLVQHESTKDPNIKSCILKKLQTLNPKRAVNDLSVDYFKVISDWYHLPILQMLNLKDFNFTPSNVAKRLGITKFEVEVAIDRMERLELIVLDSKGHFRRTQERWLVRSETSNQALRHFHRQMLAKATESLENQTPKEKFIGSETMAFDPKDLESAKQIIEECFNRLISLAENANQKTQVYHIGVQCFNLTPGLRVSGSRRNIQ